MQARQLDLYIDNYVGEWVDEYGRRLRITKINDVTASVSLFADNQAMARPWCQDKASTGMIATYDPAESPELVVELWERGKGFSLHLNFEPHYELDEDKRDSLSVGLSRFKEDDFLVGYYCLFEPLEHYVKRPA